MGVGKGLSGVEVSVDRDVDDGGSVSVVKCAADFNKGGSVARRSQGKRAEINEMGKKQKENRYFCCFLDLGNVYSKLHKF